jgi:hypothetical protein
MYIPSISPYETAGKITILHIHVFRQQTARHGCNFSNFRAVGILRRESAWPPRIYRISPSVHQSASIMTVVVLTATHSWYRQHCQEGRIGTKTLVMLGGWGHQNKVHPHVKWDENSRFWFIREELKHRIDHPVSYNRDDTSCRVQKRHTVTKCFWEILRNSTALEYIQSEPTSTKTELFSCIPCRQQTWLTPV